MMVASCKGNLVSETRVNLEFQVYKVLLQAISICGTAPACLCGLNAMPLTGRQCDPEYGQSPTLLAFCTGRAGTLPSAMVKMNQMVALECNLQLRFLQTIW